MENIEGKKQEIASDLVQREVVCCASVLISGLAKISHQLNYKEFEDAFDIDRDELMSLCERSDYEEPARAFIMDDADVDQLEEIADEHGYWSDICEIVPELTASEPDEDGDSYWNFLGSTDKVGFADEDEAREAAIEHVMPQLRERVAALVEEQGGAAEAVCNEYNLEPERSEVYEHWIVTNWFANKLAEKGETTGEVAGLTIWGRCTTGQSMSLDYVVQQIAMELWPEKLS